MKVNCLVIPHYAYSSRCAQFEKTATYKENLAENVKFVMINGIR